MKTRRFERSALALAIACGWAATSGSAMAQIAEASAPSEPTAPGTLQTITVTSEKPVGFRTKLVQVGAFRDQEALDVPLTINVIPRELLDAQAAEGVFEALKNTAGVSRLQISGAATDNLAIRGIAVDNRTSYRLNGSLPLNNLIDLPLENKERVEVLKGSSALYYGFTSPAGIVNMVTKRAGDTPVTTFAVSGNEYGQLVGHLDVGRKFGAEKQVGVRVNLLNGQLRNGIENVKGRRSLASIAADWKVTNDLGLRFDFEHIEKNLAEQAGLTQPIVAANGIVPLPRLPDPKKLLSGPWAQAVARADNMLFRGDYKLSSDWAASVELGRAETDRDERAFSQFAFTGATAAAQAASLQSGAGAIRTTFARGAQYVNRNARAEISGVFSTGFLDHEITFGAMQNKRYQNGPNFGTAGVFNSNQNFYNPVAVAAPAFNPASPVTLSPQNITDRGAYVFDRIRWGSAWQFLLGARATDYTNISTTATYPVKRTTPSAGVVWRVLPTTSLYANYIEGLVETGVAPLSALNANTVLPPAISRQREFGARTEAIEGISASAAYFEISTAGSAQTVNNVFVPGGPILYKGFEYAVNGDIGKDVSVYVSGLLLNPRLVQTGATPENVARQSASIFGEYRPSWWMSGLSVNAGAFINSRRAINSQNQGTIPGYTIYSLGARYATSIAEHATSFQLNLENAANKVYWAAAGGNILGVGLPRTLKFTAKVSF